MERINKKTTGCASCEYYFNGQCINGLPCLGLPTNNGYVDYKYGGDLATPLVQFKEKTELNKAKLELAKDYITKALKLIEEIKNGTRKDN